MFDPELLDVFRRLSEKEGFWLDVASLSDGVLSRYRCDVMGHRNRMPISEMTGFLSRVIDFRSPYTASHSKAVAVVSKTLARLYGLSSDERRRINIAGYLHDLGKIGTPIEILEKPGKLTEQEFNIVRKHPYNTFWVLRNIKSFEDIRTWSSHHHEYLDGSGYPFRLAGEEICLYSRILTVADIFVALTENRPYRAALPAGEATRILVEMAKKGKLDSRVVTLAVKRSDEIYSGMLTVRASEREDYESFLDSSFFPAFR
jgi:HD-GYP domain-containing protein (c-di-GMP phosphodiesterase class II)